MSADGKPPQGPPPKPPSDLVLSPPVVDLAEPVRSTTKYLDVVEGYITALGTHLYGGGQNSGKTSLIVYKLREILRRGAVLGHRANWPSWLRVFVFDRDSADWRYWCNVYEIECPKGYWLREDKSVTPEMLRKWAKAPHLAIEHFEREVMRMNPEPGGLLITDGGIALLGDAMTRYFDGYSHMLELQRFTSDYLKLTHIMLCHAGKPKALGATDSRARDFDKMNLGAGTMGAADMLSYLSTAAELVRAGETPPDWQRFSWTPHHAKTETFRLGRTENGLFYVLPDEELPAEKPARKSKEEKEREADVERTKLVVLLLDETAEKKMASVLVAKMMQSRFRLSQTRAYEVIKLAKEYGLVRLEERELVLCEGVTSVEESNG